MKHYSSICLLAKDENEYINEWLEWHINKLQFDHVYIYDNNSAIPLISSIDKKYKDYITIRNWTNEDYSRIMQVECYEHFIRNYGHENYWTAFIDADEFVRTIDDKIINDFLTEYENYNGIFIKWLIYNADGQYKKTDGLVRDRFKTYMNYENDLHNGKCIIKPNEFRSMDAHYPKRCITKYNVIYSNKQPCKPPNTNIPTDKIVIDHYFTKSYEEWNNKLNRGSCNILYRDLLDFFMYNKDMQPDEYDNNK
jgi:hypothetical protein